MMSARSALLLAAAAAAAAVFLGGCVHAGAALGAALSRALAPSRPSASASAAAGGEAHEAKNSRGEAKKNSRGEAKKNSRGEAKNSRGEAKKNSRGEAKNSRGEAKNSRGEAKATNSPRRAAALRPPAAAGTAAGVQEIVTALGVKERRGSGERGALSLLPQTLRAIPAHTAYAAASRPLPLERNSRVGEEALGWEFEETRSFVGKQLKTDPRLKPKDVEVNTSHLSECTSCANAKLHKHSLHHQQLLHVGTRRQLMVDDWIVHRWRNVVRTLEQPHSQKIVLYAPKLEQAASITRREPSNGSKIGSKPAGPPFGARFGCPCGATTHASGTRLWHTAELPLGHSIRVQELDDGRPSRPPLNDEHHIVSQWSQDGEANWSAPKLVSVDGNTLLKSFAFSEYDANRRNYYAGYESRLYSMACIASSKDGIRWQTVSSKADRPRKRGPDCLSGTASYLGRAADSYVQPVEGSDNKRTQVIYRKDFGTPGGWREIRGVQVVEVGTGPGFNATPFDRIGLDSSSRWRTRMRQKARPWYLDRLGKLERFRRQIYSLTLTRYAPDLWLGLLTTIEWPKDTSELKGAQLPAFSRDVTNVYLVTSRDGISIDDGWIYAHRPLIPKGSTQDEWNSGFVLPAAQIVTDKFWHRVYFEARRSHHEERFDSTGVIAVAKWPRERLVGVRTVSLQRNGFIETKPFSLVGPRLRLNVDASAPGSSVVVLIVDRTHVNGSSPVVLASSCLIRGRNGSNVDVAWKTQRSAERSVTSVGLRRAAQDEDRSRCTATLRGLVRAKEVARLRFELNGAAKLYAFEFGSQWRRVSRTTVDKTKVVIRIDEGTVRARDVDRASSASSIESTVESEDDHRAAGFKEEALGRPGVSSGLVSQAGVKFLKAANLLPRISLIRGRALIVDHPEFRLDKPSSSPTTKRSTRALAFNASAALTLPLLEYSAIAPRYFSVIDTSVDRTWCGSLHGAGVPTVLRATVAKMWRIIHRQCRQEGRDGGMLFIARGGTNLPTYSSRVFAHSHDEVLPTVRDRSSDRYGNAGQLHMWPLPVVESHDVPHNLATVFLGKPKSRPSGVESFHNKPVLYAFGGQHIESPSRRVRALRWHRSDGIYLLKARSLADVLFQRWFPRWRGDDNQTRLRILDGRHPGCTERRVTFGKACEFDGKLSVAHHRGRFLIFARANLREEGGGRFLQVAVSEGNEPDSSYAPFRLLEIEGYDSDGPGNVYFATIKPNPIDKDGSLLGLFAVNFGRHAQENGDGDAFIALSISCNGVSWAPFIALTRSIGLYGRTYDQPVDGFVVRGAHIFVYLHHDVPGISPDAVSSSRLERYSLKLDLLTRITKAAVGTMHGC